MEEDKELTYSKLTGLLKTLKNGGIMYGIPFALYLLNNVTDFVPDKYIPIVLPIAGAVGYFIKNYLENRDK
jgi:hypothetical protein